MEHSSGEEEDGFMSSEESDKMPSGGEEKRASQARVALITYRYNKMVSLVIQNFHTRDAILGYLHVLIMQHHYFLINTVNLLNTKAPH